MSAKWTDKLHQIDIMVNDFGIPDRIQLEVPRFLILQHWFTISSLHSVEYKAK